RNTAKIKVRQPLAEIKVRPGHDSERRAVQRFADQIREELNVKIVTLHDRQDVPLLGHEITLNAKNAGPKFGHRLSEVQAALARVKPATVLTALLAGSFELPCPGGPVVLDAGDVVIRSKAPAGWAGAAAGDTEVAVDIRVAEELRREGLAREVVRHVQNARKEAGLEMEDRIVLYLHTDSPELQKAIEAHR